MADVIVFTTAIRNAIRGVSDTNPVAQIEPVPLTDGRWYVGVEVLTDADYSAPKYQNLKQVQVVDYETIRHLTFDRPFPNRG